MTNTRSAPWAGWTAPLGFAFLSAMLLQGMAPALPDGEAPSPGPGASAAPDGQPAHDGVADAAAALGRWAVGRRPYADDDEQNVAPDHALEARLGDLVSAVARVQDLAQRPQRLAAAGVVEALRSCVARVGLGDRAVLVRGTVALRGLLPDGPAALELATLAAELAEPLADPSRGPLALPWRRAIQGELRFIGSWDASVADRLTERLHARARALAVGETAPLFTGHDTDGNEVRSDHLLGKVVVYRVWNDDVPASVRAHERDLTMLRRHWNAPVELVGISASSDRAKHLERLDASRIGGIQVFDGPLPTTVVDARARTGVDQLLAARPGNGSAHQGATKAFGDPLPGTVIVVDPSGVIRGRALDDVQLDRLVGMLVDEHRAFLRAQILARGPATHEGR